jgi:hypothetical protein
MQKTTLAMNKKLQFEAKYGIQGVKMIIIVPKTYHKEMLKIKKPVKVIINDSQLSIKELSFVADYGMQGEKMIIIIPKRYHTDVDTLKFKNPIKVTIVDMNLGIKAVG